MVRILKNAAIPPTEQLNHCRGRPETALFTALTCARSQMVEIRSSKKYDTFAIKRSFGDTIRATLIKRAPMRQANKPSAIRLSPITTTRRALW